ncbi:MAG TPA: hypothetical protein DCR55_05265 [Lentisphaeria bacterium]|nr:hypothetical protein [Lentisphaeria bacterium]
MSFRSILLGISVTIIVGSFVIRHARPKPSPPNPQPTAKRLLALSPGIDQILRQLDCRNHIQATAPLTQEQLAALDVDCVIATDDLHRAMALRLEIRHLRVEHETVDGVLISLSQLALLCDQQSDLPTHIKRELDACLSATALLPTRRAMVVLGHSSSHITVAPPSSYLGDLLERCNTTNACPPEYPTGLIPIKHFPAESTEVLIFTSQASPDIQFPGSSWLLADAGCLYVPGVQIVQLAQALRAAVYPKSFTSPNVSLTDIQPTAAAQKNP